MKKYKLMKSGIAMIELIFALVIMGIVLLSAPMLIQQSINSSNVALQQEAISALGTHMQMILTMHWDENNSDLQAGISPILDTNRVPFDFNITTPPAGLIGVTGRSERVGVNTIRIPSISLDKDSSETTFSDFDDIDDFNNQSFGLILFNGENTTADIGDYVDKDVNISTTVTYNEDRPVGNNLNSSTLNLGGRINSSLIIPTNIKFITSTLTSDSGVEELDKNITLKAFSCNIGTYAINGKSL